jgi:tetratricopeptide (TPR) repeat protein
MNRRATHALVAAIAALAMSGCHKDPEVAKRDYVRSGDAFIAQHKPKEAIVQYLNAERIDPRFVEARSKLAQAYFEVGDLPHAYNEIIRAADLQPNDVGAQLKAGEILLAAGRWDDAKTRADKARADDPKSVDALILEANALGGLHRFDDAVATIRSSIQIDPRRSSTYGWLGMLQMIGGNHEKAEAAFKTAVSVDPKSVDAHLSLGYFYWVMGRAPEAESEFQAALTIAPKHLTANYAMAYLYMDLRQPNKAEPYLRAIADAAPDSTGKLALADYEMRMNRPLDARQILEAIAANDHDTQRSAAKIRLAGLGLASKSGGPTAALGLVEEVLVKEPHNVEALIAKSEVLAGMQKLDDALAAAQAATHADPRSAGAQYELGLVLAARRQSDDATAAFNQALKIDPQMASAEDALAEEYLAAGRLDLAEQFGRAAISAVPGFVDPHLVLARINLMKGNVGAADSQVRTLSRVLPDSPAVQGELGQLELLEHHGPAARAAFEKALSKDPGAIDAMAGLLTIDVQDHRKDAVTTRLSAMVATYPNNSPILALAARTYLLLGDRTSAERVATSAIHADAGNFEAYRVLAQLYISERRPDDALAQVTALADKHPKDAAAQTALGMLFEMKHDPATARSHYERALAIDSNAAVAANNLAYLTARQGGNLDEALRLAQTAKARLPNQPEVNDTLGWIYCQKGLASLAIAPLQASVVADPENRGYLAHLGMAFAKTGDKVKARDLLQKALAHGDDFAEAQEARKALIELSIGLSPE